MRMFMVSIALLAACKGGPKESDESAAAGPESLVQAAIDAAGGAEALAAVQGYNIEAEGNWMGQPYKSAARFRAPHDWHWQMTSGAMTMTMWLLGPAGDCYSAMGGPAVRASPAQRQDHVGLMQAWNAAMLPDRLLAPGVTLEEAEPVVLDGVTCPAVRATFPGGTDAVTFAFDPGTKLVRQMGFMMTDHSSGQRGPCASYLSDWKDVGGVNLAHQTRMTMGPGESTETLTRVVWNPQFEETAFAAPEVVQPTILVRDVPETRVAVHVFEGPFDQVDTGIQKTFTWITENGGRVSGPLSLIYRSTTEMKTVIQVPVEMVFRKELGEGDVRLMRQPAFRFAYAAHQGKVHDCWVLLDPVTAGLPGLGCTKSGPFRVIYMTPPDAEMNCTAHVGVPVRGGEVTEAAEPCAPEEAEMEEPEGEGCAEEEGCGEMEEEEPQGA